MWLACGAFASDGASAEKQSRPWEAAWASHGRDCFWVVCALLACWVVCKVLLPLAAGAWGHGAWRALFQADVAHSYVAGQEYAGVLLEFGRTLGGVVARCAPAGAARVHLGVAAQVVL